MIDLSKHLTNLKGKAYLPVAPRIAFFRESYPLWSIVPDVVIVDGEPRMVRATICDDNGRIVAVAHKTVTAFAGGAVEKAETGAIGRALSLVGIGTLQAMDLDEGDDIAESPQPRPVAPPTRKAEPAPADDAPEHWTPLVAAADTPKAVMTLIVKIANSEGNEYRRAAALRKAADRLAAIASPADLDKAVAWAKAKGDALPLFGEMIGRWTAAASELAMAAAEVGS